VSAIQIWNGTSTNDLQIIGVQVHTFEHVYWPTLSCTHHLHNLACQSWNRSFLNLSYFRFRFVIMRATFFFLCASAVIVKSLSDDKNVAMMKGPPIASPLNCKTNYLCKQGATFFRPVVQAVSEHVIFLI
jgi:hypothetical protein